MIEDSKPNEEIPTRASPAVPTDSIHSFPSNIVANVLKEAVTYASTYLQVRLKDRSNPYDALTLAGRFNHYICEPLFHWHGENERIVMTPSLGRVSVKTLDEYQQGQVCINGGSHNYAGFYTLTDEDEDTHRKCLDQLPLADAEAVPLLNDLMLKSLARFLGADCCYSTTTGFQSNMLGIPAVAGEDTLIIVDEKSHNSIFTGAFAASKTTTTKRFRHNDMKHLESLLSTARAGTSQDGTRGILVVVEGLYSMDGTTPNLERLYELKRKYDFVLYVDEAHSFGSIGRTGRGCLELWNDEHRHNPVPADVIDVRSAVLSKAVGGLGGFVAATSCFSDRLRQRSTELRQRGESLTTSTMIQTLSFLARPVRLERNLRRLRDISLYCHQELKRLGVRVYGDSNVPMLPVYGGRPSKASHLSYLLRKAGLVTSPTGAPAVDYWESRCRITLSADYSDAEVNRLIDIVFEASRKVGLCKSNHIARQPYRSLEDDDKNLLAQQLESQEANSFLDSLIQHQIEQSIMSKSPAHLRFEEIAIPSVIQAGHASRWRYGLGAGSSRWILGTFPPHIETETLLARVLKQPLAMTYPDSDLGLMSTVASLCRPIIGRKNHYFLLPAKLPSTAEEGLRISSKKSGTTLIRYADHESMVAIFRALVVRRDSYITLYLEPFRTGGYVDLRDLANRLAGGISNIRGCTLLLNDSAGLGQRGLGVTDSADMAAISRILSARLLISGSFYHGMGLPGGYLAGDSTLIEELRYTSRCYMFTTSAQPFILAMVAESLKSKLLPRVELSSEASLDSKVNGQKQQRCLIEEKGTLGMFQELGRLGLIRSLAIRFSVIFFTLVLSFLLTSWSRM